MEAVYRFSGWLSKISNLIGGLSIIFIISVTMVDVVTRYLFKLTDGSMGFTIKGGVELVSYSMLFALLSAFVSYIERSQIIVDVFTQKMSHKLKAPLMGVYMAIFIIVGAVMAWGLFDKMHDSIEYGNVTQDLRISMTPIYAFSAFLCVLLTIRTIIETIKIFQTGNFHNAEEAG